MLHRHIAMTALAATLSLMGCRTEAPPAAHPLSERIEGPATLPNQPGSSSLNGVPVQVPDTAVTARPSLEATAAEAVADKAAEPGVEVAAEPDPIALLTFYSTDEPAAGNNDIFVEMHEDERDAAVPDINTPDNETNPRLSKKGTWLVFQRTLNSIPDVRFFPDALAPKRGPQQDIYLYNMVTGMVSSLPGLNTAAFDEYAPDVSDDGTLIVYLTNRLGYPEVRLYNTTTGQSFEVPGLNRSFKDVTWPCISGDGTRIAFGASEAPGSGIAVDNTGNPTGGAAFTGGALTPAESNIYVYDLRTATQLRPPHLNTDYDEYEPALSPDGSRLLFVTNRFGSEDILEIDLQTNLLDNLSRLNSLRKDEQHPLYEDTDMTTILYQIKPKDGEDLPDLQRYHRKMRLIEQVTIDGGKRAPRPELGSAADLPSP